MKPDDAYYQILEIEPGASQTEVKQAYRDLTLVWHPDRFFDNPRLRLKAEEKLKQLNSAYSFLKAYQPQATQVARSEVKSDQPADIFLKFKRLKDLLESNRLKEADLETKQLLLQLTNREQEGWLRPEDVKSLPHPSLLAIDQLWLKYSNGQFGFSVQSQIWRELSCSSSPNIAVQTISENRFGKFIHWHGKSTWLSPWDTFNYDRQLPKGSLPREYIFALSGWWSYSKRWVGYLLWRFDEIFLKF
jgi:hypothetical protein